MTGWKNIRSAFNIWTDLMTSNYDGYTVLDYDDSYTECREWFWQTLGEDDVYPKEFLEHLMQMVDDIETGKVKTYPIDEVLDKVKDIMEDNS
jgi:hypothetical protein